MSDIEENLEEYNYYCECVSVDNSNLTGEFTRVSADFAFWNVKYTAALEKFLRAKATREQEWARVYLLNSAKAEFDKKKMTVDLLKSTVESEPSYQHAVDNEITCEVEVTRLKGTLEAIRTKKDMLVQAGAQLRVELQNDPIIRARIQNSKYTTEE